MNFFWGLALTVCLTIGIVFMVFGIVNEQALLLAFGSFSVGVFGYVALTYD